MFGTNAIRKVVALLLLVSLLVSSLSVGLADESLYFLAPGNSKKVDIYLRIFVPSSKSPKNSVGHYDLMIKGDLRFHGKTFKNPVFSYRTDGSLEVFSAKDTKSVYKHSSPSDYYYGNHLYYYHTSVDGLSNVYKFLNAVGDNVKSVSTHPNCSRAFKCGLKGTFSKYKVKYVNCFLAVAKWMQIFGKNSLMKYYKNFYKGDHTSYLPKTFIKKFDGKIVKKF